MMVGWENLCTSQTHGTDPKYVCVSQFNRSTWLHDNTFCIQEQCLSTKSGSSLSCTLTARKKKQVGTFGSHNRVHMSKVSVCIIHLPWEVTHTCMTKRSNRNLRFVTSQEDLSVLLLNNKNSFVLRTSWYSEAFRMSLQQCVFTPSRARVTRHTATVRIISWLLRTVDNDISHH